jgi:hypothetical protein
MKIEITYTTIGAPSRTIPADVVLPGLADVREQEHAQPPIAELPRANPDDFTLTPPPAAEPVQPRRGLFD